MTTVTARAHTNIALIKYWGKRDAAQMLPATSSVSMTLADFYTDTTVTFLANQAGDTFTLDGQLQPVPAKVTAVLTEIRQLAGWSQSAQVRSVNHVPTAAGLASSASAYAALALAGSRAAGLSLSPQGLSRLARHGSGSAARSIFGGLAIWHRGSGDSDSVAEPLPMPNLALRMIVVVVSAAAKTISSTQAMANTAATSPFYPAWVAANEAAAQQMVAALAASDFPRIGHLTEQSSMQMHATMLAADPAFTYFQPATLRVWQLVQELRAAGVPAYATMDAGPNVKILTLAAHVDAVVAKLTPEFGQQLRVTGPGPAATVLEERP